MKIPEIRIKLIGDRPEPGKRYKLVRAPGPVVARPPTPEELPFCRPDKHGMIRTELLYMAVGMKDE